MVCATLFGKLLKIWAVISGNAIFLLFLVCSADLDNSRLFSYHLKYYSFLFMHQISSWVVCKNQNGKHSMYFLYITKLSEQMLLWRTRTSLTYKATSLHCSCFARLAMAENNKRELYSQPI